MGASLVVTKGGVEEPRCKQGCPAGIDVSRYIRFIKEGKFPQAVGVVRERTPFAGVLAYVCPGFCELRCRRAEVDEPVAINALKRFVIDREQSVAKQKSVKSTTSRVAVVGSGPAGLTAAYYLSKVCGHKVTVFEAFPVAGGMMRLGIPEYRLPKRFLDAEIEIVKETGVDIRTNMRIKSADSLFEQGFDAVFISIGAWQSARLMIEGKDLPGVVDGLYLLKELNLGGRYEVGQRVAVIGGGNVAIDAARVARRLGARDVHIFYRRSREEMPAALDEIEQALEEGVRITFLVVPFRITRKDKSLSVEFIRMRLGAMGESARREPEQIPGSEFSMTFDTVIAAIGERPEIPTGFGIAAGKDSNIRTDAVKLTTSKSGVFAGGDCVTGPATVIEAIAAGRKAAINIDRYLGGEGVIDETFVSEQEAAAQPWEESILEIPRQRMPFLYNMEHIKGFDTVELGFTEEMAMREAERCLRCDLALPITIDLAKCVECYSCQMTCSLVYQHAFNPEKGRIIVDLQKGIHYDTECVGGCLLCARGCLAGAISYRNNGDECAEESSRS